MRFPSESPAPYAVAPETWLIPTFTASPTGGSFGAHSLVIRGAEPVIVDTGCRFVREAWLDQVFSIVEPADVRWIFLSHDDHDHVGNIDAVLDRCPNATVVAIFGIFGRLALDVELPPERMRWLDVGESLELPDRTLHLVRPPMFDSPTTRGLFDDATRMLWAVDSFGTFTPGAVFEAADVPAEIYDPSFAALNSSNTPWLEFVDTARFATHVQHTAGLGIEVAASAHGPIHRGTEISDAFARTLALAAQPPVPSPGQPLLDQLVAMLDLAVA